MPESSKKRSTNHLDDFGMSIQPISKKLSSICAVKIDDSNQNNTETKEIHKRPEISCQPESLSRNKRLFSSLMGHLGKAKNNLETDSRIDIQNAAINTATEKHSYESQRLYMLHNQIKESIQQKVSFICTSLMI